MVLLSNLKTNTNQSKSGAIAPLFFNINFSYVYNLYLSIKAPQKPLLN